MLRFTIHTLYLLLLLPIFLRWSTQQAEQQIDKMQEAAFNTPGAESPVPPAVVMGALTLFASHFLVGSLLRQRWWQSLFALIVSLSLGVALFVKNIKITIK